MKIDIVCVVLGGSCAVSVIRDIRIYQHFFVVRVVSGVVGVAGVVVGSGFDVVRVLCLQVSARLARVFKP